MPACWRNIFSLAQFVGELLREICDTPISGSFNVASKEYWHLGILLIKKASSPSCDSAIRPWAYHFFLSLSLPLSPKQSLLLLMVLIEEKVHGSGSPKRQENLSWGSHKEAREKSGTWVKRYYLNQDSKMWIEEDKELTWEFGGTQRQCRKRGF